MVSELLEQALSPIVWLMLTILEFYISIIGSTGASILLLSFTFSLLALPFRRKAERFEQRIGAKINAVDEEVRKLKKDMKGEKLFFATEEVYKKHSFHPIQSIGRGASFFVMLPILISAIFLLSADGVLQGESFLVIHDLSKPDQFFHSFHILPLIMTAITIVDARLRFKEDKNAQNRFYGIAAVLLVLVYNLPSGLILYWTGSNILSLFLVKLRSMANSNL